MSTAPKPVYSLTGRLNHWISAALVLVMLGIGWSLYSGVLSQGLSGSVRDFHKALGVVVLVFGLWRVGYRFVKGFPPVVTGTPSWQVVSARVAHYVLLAGILVMPLSGIAWGFYAGRDLSVFGLFTLQGSAVENEALSDIGSTIHFYAGSIVTFVVFIHLLAALKHHFIDKDATLQRMLGR